MNRFIPTFERISHNFVRLPREVYVYVAFGVLLFLIVKELFVFTVLNHSYYQGLADKQQTAELTNPVSRGNIYSDNDLGKILATSVYLNDIAIDPSIPGDKQKLGDFLTEVVYMETCYLKNAVDCRDNLIRFLNVLEIPDFRVNEAYIRGKIREKIAQRISMTKVTSVLIDETLTPEQIYQLEKFSLHGIYINGANLFINPEEISDENTTALKLQSILGGEVSQIQKEIRKREMKYVSIYNKLSISTSEMIKQKLDEENQALSRGFIKKEQTIGQFIILEPKHHRFYPENGLAASVIGFVNSQGEGAYGIEGYYNSILKGKQQESKVKVDAQGRPVDSYSFTEEKDSTAGANITLTVDRNVQKAVEDIINVDVKTYRANSISVVVMDPKTGSILAMATTPSFNPNRYGDALELTRVTPDKFPNPQLDLRGATVLAIDNLKGKEYVYNGKKIFLSPIQYEQYNDSTLEKYVFTNREGAGVYTNHAIQDIYEPGSIFKPILMASAVDAGEITPNDMYQDNGSVKIDTYTIKNVISACMGYHSFLHAMNYSCNVGMIRIAQKMGKSIYHKYLDSFGFGRKTGITLEGELSGRLDPPEKWSRAQLLTTSYGLGIGVTMLQMATAYSTIANGGVYYKPQIIKKIEFADGKTQSFKSEADHRVLKESTSKTMIDVLVDGVVHGEARVGKIVGYTMAGKTGTAQIAYKGKYELGQAATMASFAGFGPAEDPKFVVIVRVKRPRASEWGGATAGGTFNQIAQYLLNYYKIPPKK